VSDARQPSLSSFFPRGSLPLPERGLVTDVDVGAALREVGFLREDERRDAFVSSFGSVTAVTTKISPTPPCVMKTFEPLRT
jgi:hypothetical protein